MKVKARFYGILTEWVGAGEIDIELPAGASYGNLLNEIGRLYGKDMPEKLWNKELNDFAGSVSAVDSDGNTVSRDSPLKEGEEITFLLKVAGG